ncbi:MAG: PDZ domain-containing protein, partial [Chloroflexota bacterium]|nr:PDZ domain-containing protein [Chloroflexota bacterium]
MNGASISLTFRSFRALGLTVVGAALLASCSAGAASPPSAQPSAASGSAAASAKPSASPSASSSPSGQLGMIFEVNNVGWQDVLKTPAKRGMAIVVVLPNQPGAKAGLVEGDVVTKMNGVDLFNANVANREIRKLKVGQKVSLDVERKNGPAKVDLTVDPAQKIDLAGILNDLVKTDPTSARA